MTSLVEVAKLVRQGNDTSEESNKHLQSLDNSFNKFFKIQERDRLDRLEDKLDAARTRRVTATGTGRAAGTGALGAAAGAATGLMGNLKDFLLFLANPLGWVKLLAKATFGLGAAVVGASYKALRNVVDDRLKTQRGLLRIEAKQLKDAQVAEKKAIQTKITTEQKATNDAKRAMKEQIRAAEKQFKIDQDKAARAEIVRKARLDFEMQQEKLARARAEKKAQADYQRRLNASIRGSNTGTLREVVNEGKSNFSNASTTDSTVVRKPLPVMTAPDAIGGAIDVNRVSDSVSRPGLSIDSAKQPIVSNDPETTKLIKASDSLKGFSDAELNRAGVYRSTNSLGVDQYKTIEGNKFVNHQDLLRQVELDKVNAAKGKTLTDVKKTATKFTGIAGPGGIRVGSAAIDPIGAAIQESLEYGARSTAGTAARIFGSAARIFGSAAFNAATLSVIPTTMGDGSISGPFQGLYENMIAALIEGDPRNVVAARDHMKEYVDKVAGGNLEHVTSSAEMLGLSDYILGASEQDLKAFTRMQYAKRTGKVFRRDPIQAPRAYGSGRVSGMDAGFIGDELNALDAISERNYRMGISPSVSQVNNNTKYETSGIYFGEGISPNDNLNGGSFEVIG